MPLKAIASDGNTTSIHSPNDFETVFNIRYLPSLCFQNEKTQKKIEKQCARAAHKERITTHQKWLGQYYSREILGHIPLDLTIAWIDEKIGYGVWTNQDISAQTYIGEYTGVLRKRTFFGRWKNRYCFDYNIGEGRNSSYVIDAQDSGNHTRFINHSFKPNLEPVSVYFQGLIHIIIFASKAIASGTQLCYDYGEDYWKRRDEPKNLDFGFF
jgi:SET domain-containing protein